MKLRKDGRNEVKEGWKEGKKEGRKGTVKIKQGKKNAKIILISIESTNVVLVKLYRVLKYGLQKERALDCLIFSTSFTFQRVNPTVFKFN
jgi:hypothetical protein